MHKAFAQAFCMHVVHQGYPWAITAQAAYLSNISLVNEPAKLAHIVHLLL